MKKKNVVVLVLLLVIGFAAVASVLIINGNVSVSFDSTEFTSGIVFSKAESTDGTATIGADEQSITFDTKTLSMVDETAVLNFEVNNKSNQYDANVVVTCELKDSFSSYNDYLDITHDLTSPFTLTAGNKQAGTLTIKLKKAYTDGEVAPELTCTLAASPASKDTTN